MTEFPIKNKILMINGKSFRCEDCRSNMFTEYQRAHYKCNGCGANYTGVPLIEQAPTTKKIKK